MKILIGNSFPLSLIRRKAVIIPVGLDEFVKYSADKEVCSFWGHLNTLEAAEKITRLTLKPITERPSVILDTEFYPSFNNYSFRECWIVSPEYVPGFRPQIGEEVAEEKILNWQILKIKWV